MLIYYPLVVLGGGTNDFTVSTGCQVWELKTEALFRVISTSYGDVVLSQDQGLVQPWIWCHNRSNVATFPPGTERCLASVFSAFTRASLKRLMTTQACLCTLETGLLQRRPSEAPAWFDAKEGS